MKELIRHILREHISEQKEKYSDEDIEREARKFTNIKDFRENSPNFYGQAKKRGLMPKFNEFLQSKITSWSDEMLTKLAKQYDTLKDFREKNGSAYKIASNRGILDNITKHIPRPKVWTYDEAKQEAEKYDSFSDFQKNSPAFSQSYKNGWTNEFKEFLKLKKGEWEKYTKDMVISDVAKSHNRVEFREKFPISYRAARNRGWYDEVTAVLDKVVDDRTRLIYAYEFTDNSVYVGLTVNEKRRKSGHLNVEEIESPVAKHMVDTGLTPIYKIIAKDLTPKEAQESEGCTEEIYRQNGWKILNRYKTGSLGACRRFWTKELAHDSAKRFKTPIEFKKGDIKAYQAAQKYGWMKDITQHMESGVKRVWTYEKTKEFAKNFKSRGEMKAANQNAYGAARVNGWLDEFFPQKFKNQFDKNK
jgi:hypothetical protein